MDSILNKVHADREFFNSLGNAYPADESVGIKREQIGDVTSYWFTPENFDDSVTFFKKIKQVQSDTRMKEYKGQNHAWLLADIKSKASKNAIADIKKFIP